MTLEEAILEQHIKAVAEMIVQSLSDINKSYIHSSKGVKVTHIMDVELKPVGE